MTQLAKKYPDLVQVSKIGTTFEKRPIMVLKVLRDFNVTLIYPSGKLCYLDFQLTVTNPRIRTIKPLFLFESGIHAVG